mgnify:CR=1 FL=1
MRESILLQKLSKPERGNGCSMSLVVMLLVLLLLPLLLMLPLLLLLLVVAKFCGAAVKVREVPVG